MVFSMAFARVLAFVVCGVTVVTAQTQEAEAGMPAPETRDTLSSLQLEANALAASGNQMFYIGNGMAFVGVAGFIAASKWGQEQYLFPCTMAYYVGLPVLGIGASRVYRAYRLQNPYAPDDGYNPWRLYRLGWVAQGAGAVLMFAGIISLVDDIGEGSDGGGEGVGLLVAGMVVSTAGTVLHGVSWYQFAARRAEANRLLRKSSPQGLTMTLEPMLPVSSRGSIDGAGARLRLRF
jgi:hypothetical protein